VAQGDRGNYDELVSYLHLKRNLSPDEVAILVVGCWFGDHNYVRCCCIVFFFFFSV